MTKDRLLLQRDQDFMHYDRGASVVSAGPQPGHGGGLETMTCHFCRSADLWLYLTCGVCQLTTHAKCYYTVRHRGIETGISEASKRVSIFSFATQGGKQVSFYFRQRNWVQAREAQIRFPAG